MVDDVLLFTHPAMLDHRPPEGHPERPARLSAVLAALEGMALDRREAPLANRAALARVHSAAHLDLLDRAFAATDGGRMVALDGGDTIIGPGSQEAALRAAGAVTAAVDAVRAGAGKAAFCAVRPPGHHAEPDAAMGFCLINNIAVGALHALEAHGLSRVAIIDFDVHHGNGGEASALGDPRILFASTHQSPLYPGTGAAELRGPHGNIFNAPLPPGADGAAWRAAMRAHILPAVAAFDPQLIFVSAGFDAHADDPLAQLGLTEADFAWGAHAIVDLAQLHCNGQVVSALEGGYDLRALGRSSAAFVGALGSQA